MHDKFKKRFQGGPASSRTRHQIALEAARRLFDVIGPAEGDVQRLRDATEGEYYAAKRKAAAVLGHRVRPGDLPSDSEVREQVVGLARARSRPSESPPEPEGDEALRSLADHLERFALYKLRLGPLDAVKFDPRTHPEGDALYHSLQVFELARAARPYDEEFLLAALLHEVGRVIDPRDPVVAGLQSLRGAVTARTLWLIEHLTETRERRPPDAPEWRDDLKLLHDLDESGRVPGAPVATIDQTLEYLQGLEREDYLEEDGT